MVETSAVDSIYQRAFDLRTADGYRAWREQKLANYPSSVSELAVDVSDINHLSVEEQDALIKRCRKTNMAIYRSARPLQSKDALRAVCRLFGLENLDKNLYADDDGISALRVSREKRQFEYIPYSNKPIKWHTDGYYNTLDNKIRAMVLHCVNPALHGGENQYLDHEMIYLMMRDENPDYIAALMQEDVMTIPANVENGVEIRPAQTGPVFSVDPVSGDLHMRYTARTHSIEWKDDDDVMAAVRYLEKKLASDLPYIFKYRLEANEGILSNNILHTRTKFDNGSLASEQRLMYRARFCDRMQRTSLIDLQ